MSTEQDYNRRWIFWLKIFLILAAVVFILLAAFFVFKVHSEGRFALREAKNIKLAMLTSDIEQYGVGKSIYMPERHNGLSDAAMLAIERYAGVDDGVTLLSYDRKSREVKMFTYRTLHYLVTYTYDGEREDWTVDYLWRIFVY
ncbi:MAG: hypothetical protein J6X66_07345 [Lachnospiraceae bacterium]|nr:hypothetical protein [Lachnospiraceae bacterium]